MSVTSVVTSTSADTPKIPPAATYVFPAQQAREIQVNFCKNPKCANYGVPASMRKYKHRSKVLSALPGTEYTLHARGALLPCLKCRLCDEILPLKSNLGVIEELARLTRHHTEPQPTCCPNEGCAHHWTPIGAKGAYYAYGKTEQGSKRYKCRSCGKTFSVASRTTLRQRLPHKNLEVFKLLVNKVPLSRICEITGISIQTLYDKVDFIHRQCMAFAAKHERSLFEGKAFSRLHIAVDRQDYVVNWTQRRDKRNVTLRAIGSADLKSGYVFGMHLNFDAEVSPEEVEPHAVAIGDYHTQYPFRRYARLWLEPDYERALQEGIQRKARRKRARTGSLNESIETAYAEAAERADVESPDSVSAAEAWPRRGMQVRTEYTLYAHFYLLRHLVRGAEQVRFYLDQESGIRAALLAAFEREVKERRCEAFYVRINKDMTVDEKRALITASRAAFKAMQDDNPDLSPSEVEVLMMKEEISRAAALGKWSDRWCVHPFPNQAEAEKAVCRLTDLDDEVAPDRQDEHENRIARLYLRASLHPVDRFFMQVRRRLSLLERPIGSPNNAGRMWHGYSAYQPENIEKTLDIFRVFYNYVLTGKDGKTAAMKLGLAERPASIEEILRSK